MFPCSERLSKLLPPRPDRGEHAGKGSGIAARLPLRAILGLSLVLAASDPARAEIGDKVYLQGLTDAELWETGAQTDLSRNGGDPAGLGRLRRWAVGGFTDQIQGFAMGSLEGGKATYDQQTDTTLEQAYLRFSFAAPKRMVIQAGKMTLPVGNFSRRYLSSQNPLIGTPANYRVAYPVGLELTGSVGRFEGVAAVLDRPITDPEVLLDEDPSTAYRPLLGAALIPMVGMRLGAYYTQGPYLTDKWQSMIPGGADWKDFDERVAGFDLQFSRAHFELNGEFSKSRYEIPQDNHGEGKNYYIEPKYTWSPRWFTALRLERSHLPYVWPETTIPWWISVKKVYDAEVGVGFRVDPNLLLKASYRYASERTTVGSYYNAQDNGAFAFQVSYSFDVNRWIERPQ